ncbi:polysaccharide deacetylase family protein [Kiritimatiellaeota bacterium B1221]|nr:polysaccharide deacetylase family protein [Kiritimatiellaeota bacterium B1221]
MKKSLLPLFCFCLSASQLSAQTEHSDGLFNLKDKPSAARFELSKERVWPEETGKPEVCLWSGDRYAAVSITIDDNWASNHEWWLNITKELDLQVTWFVITERVGTGAHWGTWEGFRALAEAGHSIQSHSANHLNQADGQWPGIDWEYAASKKALEENIPDHHILALAYPGGKNSDLNDREVAAQYYITARGTRGTPNPANQIDYLQTNSAKISRPYIDAILEGTSDVKWLSGGQYKRAWLSAHFHGVTGEAIEKTETDLRYLASRKKDLWIAPFLEVARYGQQRDTHTITLNENTESRIRYTLTDQMRDEFYDLPLTVKIKLPASWNRARAKQGDKLLEVETVEHEGQKYALIPAVPDRGEVVVIPGT